jgi:hypothetical protein
VIGKETVVEEKKMKKPHHTIDVRNILCIPDYIKYFFYRMSAY